MIRNRKILRGIIIGLLCICTVYLVYSIISNPFGQKDNIMFALAVTAGFIALASNKNEDKGE